MWHSVSLNSVFECTRALQCENLPSQPTSLCGKALRPDEKAAPHLVPVAVVTVLHLDIRISARHPTCRQRTTTKRCCEAAARNSRTRHARARAVFAATSVRVQVLVLGRALQSRTPGGSACCDWNGCGGRTATRAESTVLRRGLSKGTWRVEVPATRAGGVDKVLGA